MEPLKPLVYAICQAVFLLILVALIVCLVVALIAMIKYCWDWLKEQRILRNKELFEEWFKHEIARRTEIGEIGYRIDRIGIYRYMEE